MCAINKQQLYEDTEGWETVFILFFKMLSRTFFSACLVDSYAISISGLFALTISNLNSIVWFLHAHSTIRIKNPYQARVFLERGPAIVQSKEIVND